MLANRWRQKFEVCTYDGINGAGSACPGRPPGNGGAPPPGRFGMAGAARAAAGGGGGPRLEPPPSEPYNVATKKPYVITQFLTLALYVR